MTVTENNALAFLGLYNAYKIGFISTDFGKPTYHFLMLFSASQSDISVFQLTQIPCPLMGYI